MFGALSMTANNNPQAGLEGLRKYLDRLTAELGAEINQDCYYPECSCGIARLALTPEITLNCGLMPGGSCDNLDTCLPEFSSDPWNIDQFSYGHDEVGASSDIALWPGGLDAADVESMSWYSNGMGFTVQGVASGFFLAFDVGQAYSLEDGVTYAGTPAENILDTAWDHQWVDDGNKIVSITTNPLTIKVYDVSTANDPLGGINTSPLSTLVINNERSDLQDDMPGVKIWMQNDGLSMWMWCRKSGAGEAAFRRLLYIKLTTPFDVSSAVYNRLSQELMDPSGGDMTNNTIQSLSSDLYSAKVIVYTNHDGGSIWKYDICSFQENFITCTALPAQQAVDLSANLNDNIRGAEMNPNGSSMLFFGGGSQGDRLYKGTFGEIANDCNIWNIYINADIAEVRDTGLGGDFYGWSREGNMNHKFHNPDIFNLCPTATPSNTHYNKPSGVIPYVYDETGVGVVGSEIAKSSSCFNNGFPRAMIYSPNVAQAYLIVGVTGSFIDLPRFDVFAEDADGNVYSWYDFDPESGATNANKVWMTDNLRTTHILSEAGQEQEIIRINGNAGGDELLQSTNKLSHPPWFSQPGWCAVELPEGGCDWYQNFYNFETYGGLYNWKAAHTNGICPLGWHVPTESDWNWLEENVADLGAEWNGVAGGPDLRGETTESGWKTMEGGRYHWSNPNGYMDDLATGKTYPFDAKGTGFFWAAEYGSYVENNFPFREDSAAWTFNGDAANSWIRRWSNTQEGLGLSNLGSADAMATIRCKLDDGVPSLRNKDGGSSWRNHTTGGNGFGAAMLPKYINFVGDHASATRAEYCNSVGCSSFVSFDDDGASVITNEEVRQYQFDNGKWSLFQCATDRGGSCNDPRVSMYVECGGCDGVLAQNVDVFNTCQGPVVE